MSHVARFHPRTLQRGPVLLAALVLAFVAAPALAEGPAVREANFRVAADYSWTHLFSDDVFRFSPAPTTLVSAAEVDIDAGGFTGVYTMPLTDLGEQFGARVYGGPRFGKVHPDTFEETKTYGMTLGGDVFWRDPEVGEIGVGSFYDFVYSEQGANPAPGSIDRSDHEAGVTAFGRLFFGDGSGLSVDLDAATAFSDANIDDNGALSAERTYSAVGGIRTYFNDHASVRLGGLWSRTNFGTTEFVEDRLATIDVEALLPTSTNVILGGGMVIGKRDTGSPGFQNFGRLVYGINLQATVSFAGAESLLELRRNFF